MSITSQPSKQYGNPSLMEKGALILSVFLHMPIVLVWNLASSPFHRSSRTKTWGRLLADNITRHLFTRLSIKQLQWIMGNTGPFYEGWAKENGLPVVVDELSEDTRLFWIGKQRKDRVILYFHGGAFLFPMAGNVASYWKYIQDELAKKNIDVGVAMLNYSLLPSATFPTPLKQAVAAIEHLISTGVEPQNIQIIGDSAGANLALQLISHMLHPLDGVRPLNLPSRIRGVYLMSPWVLLRDTDGSMTSNVNDIIGPKCINIWGNEVLEGVPDSQLPYIEASSAPDSWFKSVDTVVERVLISAGSDECLRDSIEVLAKQICSFHDGATFWMQENGVHGEAYLDFSTKEAKSGKITPQILDWFATGFKEV